MEDTGIMESKTICSVIGWIILVAGIIGSLVLTFAVGKAFNLELALGTFVVSMCSVLFMASIMWALADALNKLDSINKNLKSIKDGRSNRGALGIDNRARYDYGNNGPGMMR